MTTAELVELTVDRHCLGGDTARRAVAVGLLVAGYPPEASEVSAADAFDIVDRATCYW